MTGRGNPWKRRRPGNPTGEGAPPAGGEGEGQEETAEASEAPPEVSGAEAEDERAAAEAGDPATEVADATAELEALRDRHLRLAAEFENYRKRTRRELGETREQAQADLARMILGTLDDLARVATIPSETTTVQALEEGIQIIERNLRKQLEDAGLRRIEAEGSPFDPNLHEGLTVAAAPREEEDETVGRVLVDGYLFGQRLVRPAQVEVLRWGGDREEGGEAREVEDARPPDADEPTLDSGEAGDGR